MSSNKMISIITILLISVIGQARIIHCDGDFQFHDTDGVIYLPMNSTTSYQVEGYLYKNYLARQYYVTGVVWNDFHNAFFKSDVYSTVKLYKYTNGEKAFSLVLLRTGFETKQLKFGNCDF
jgi:hypothetical protein